MKAGEPIFKRSNCSTLRSGSLPPGSKTIYERSESSTPWSETLPPGSRAQYLRGVRASLPEVEVCHLEAAACLPGADEYVRGAKRLLPGVNEYCFGVEVLLPGELVFCPGGNNSLSVGKELFLFGAKQKKRYSEHEHIKTMSERGKRAFRLNLL